MFKANSNSYANPNFTNVMKPVNSIIDGIGPLILPLIGYSQRAFDAYAPLVAQRSEGLPIFRPSAMAAGKPFHYFYWPILMNPKNIKRLNFFFANSSSPLPATTPNASFASHWHFVFFWHCPTDANAFPLPTIAPISPCHALFSKFIRQSVSPQCGPARTPNSSFIGWKFGNGQRSAKFGDARKNNRRKEEK